MLLMHFISDGVRVVTKNWVLGVLEIKTRNGFIEFYNLWKMKKKKISNFRRSTLRNFQNPNLGTYKYPTTHHYDLPWEEVVLNPLLSISIKKVHLKEKPGLGRAGSFWCRLFWTQSSLHQKLPALPRLGFSFKWTFLIEILYNGLNTTSFHDKSSNSRYLHFLRDTYSA